jgi:hypothetical protein
VIFRNRPPDARRCRSASIYGAGHADRQSLHPTREGHARVGFDEYVEVVGLDAELQESKMSP